MNSNEIEKIIEACRPASDDLHLPEFAEAARQVEADARLRQRYAQTQRLDAAIASAMHDVPIPPGLADRLLAAVQSSPDAPRGCPGLMSDQQSRPNQSEIRNPKSEIKRVRRRWVVWTAASLAAAAIVGAVIVWLAPAKNITIHQLARQSESWWSEAEAQFVRQGGKSLEGNEDVLRGYPLSSYIRRRPQRWLWFEAQEMDRKAVAYDLTPAGASSAVLLVMRTPSGLKVRDLPGSPWKLLPGVSRGLKIGAWQENSLLYVLVVQGDDAYYQNFIKRHADLAALGRISRLTRKA